jgi:hypothetical protein
MTEPRYFDVRISFTDRGVGSARIFRVRNRCRLDAVREALNQQLDGMQDISEIRVRLSENQNDD